MHQSIPSHLRGRREKLFDGRWTPLDRNAKARITVYAKALMRRTEKGRHYGPVTAKTLAVLQALLWGFHNRHSGKCFPSYEAIAERADCARSTVALAIKALEDAGILTWVNRIVRVGLGRDLFGKPTVVRVLRTSNGYAFNDPKPGGNTSFRQLSSKSDLLTGTRNQVLKAKQEATGEGLAAALTRLGQALGRGEAEIESRLTMPTGSIGRATMPTK